MKFIKETRVKGVVSLFVALLLFAVMATPNIVKAAEQQNSDEWQFTAELYLWYASIDGTSTVGDLDIKADDLIDGLNMAFMGNIGVKKDRWGFMLDAIYLNASNNQNVITRIGGVNTDVEMTGWIITPMVGYEVVESENVSLNIFAGARYLYLDTSIGLRNTDPAGPPFAINPSDSGNNWDGIIGVRGDIFLSPHWFIPYHLDIGAGNSNFTWQAFTGLGYRFKNFDILAGYRYLSWDFDDNDVIEDLNVSGVGAGIKFYF